jgi:hypothetical protein
MQNKQKLITLQYHKNYFMKKLLTTVTFYYQSSFLGNAYFYQPQIIFKILKTTALKTKINTSTFLILISRAEKL